MTTKTFSENFKAIANDARLLAFLNYTLLMFMSMTFGLTAVAALVLASLAEDKAPDWLKSHYTFQKRSLWYGIAPVLVTAVLYTFGARHPGTVMVYIGPVLFVLTLAYTVGRAIVGFNHLLHNRPVPRPTTWLV